MMKKIMSNFSSDDAFSLSTEQILMIAAVGALVMYITYTIGTSLKGTAKKTTDEIDKWDPAKVFPVK